jgi:hypothetical protein
MVPTYRNKPAVSVLTTTRNVITVVGELLLYSLPDCLIFCCEEHERCVDGIYWHFRCWTQIGGRHFRACVYVNSVDTVKDVQ